MEAKGVQAVLEAGSPCSHSQLLTAPPPCLNSVFSQGRTESAQAGSFSTVPPSMALKLRAHIHSRNPAEALGSVSPRGVRQMETWGGGIHPLCRLTSVLKDLAMWDKDRQPIWLRSQEVISINEAPVRKCSSQIRVQGLRAPGDSSRWPAGCRFQYSCL